MSQPKTRHVWVRREYDPRTVPGLVLEWEQRDGTWWARVAYVVEGATMVDWIVGSSLDPVKTQPNIGSAYG